MRPSAPATATEDPEARDHRQIRQAVLAAKRAAVIDLRARGAIGEEALRRVDWDIDLEELRSGI